MRIYAKTHVGYRREHNEDSFYVPADSSNASFVIVADGMGGPQAGEVASAVAVDEAKKVLYALSDQVPEKALVAAADQANQKVQSLRQEKQYEGMGTTMTMAILLQENIVVGNVGDSRAYLLHDNTLKLITRDHSLVEELVERGSITKEQALHHPHRHMITRAIGVEPSVHIDVFEVPWQSDDVLLLCTDGLTNMVSHDALEQLMVENIHSDVLHTILVDAALKGGGQDNVTAIVVRHT